MLSNRYGHFSRDGLTFRVTDSRTPMPWVNVVCNGRYGFVISQNGGGFSWLDNSQLNVLTRWEMDLARDQHGKFLYVSDLESREVWSLAPSPCRALYDEYTCEHTQGLTTFHTKHHGIAATWTMAVAPADALEIWRVELTNQSAKPRRIRIASYFEWCCGVAPDTKREFHRLFITTRHDAGRRAISAIKNMWDVSPRHEGEHWNRPWPYGAMHAVGGVEFEADLAIADKSLFLGRYGDTARPEAMLAPMPVSGGFGRFGDGVAALGGNLTIQPGQTARLHYLLAIDASVKEAAAIIDRYNSSEAVDRAIAAASEAWTKRLGATRIQTKADDFDLLNNTWLPYQAISGRIWGRTGYYQQSGAYGFRDQLQDSQVWLPIEPKRTREQLLLHARHQFADGSVYHWWHPLTETGLRTQCSDDYLWLPFVFANYVKETGDVGALRERTPFVDDSSPTTMLEHCLRAFRKSFARFSPRGLPLIGSCDWNDGLSALGIKGKGESTWLAFFLVNLLEEFATLLEKIGDRATAADFRARREALIKSVNEHAWDGEWFKRATRDDGTWIGMSSDAEGRIYLNAQTWAILAGATDETRAEKAWASVRQHLLAPMGPLLLAPAYTEPDTSIGYITRYAPGLRENGGVYMHAATWALMAACKLGDAEAAGKIWKSISPPLRGGGEAASSSAIANDPDAYRAEPYVLPGNVDGPISEYPGRAGWTWYTGSAAWLNRVSLEWLLGIRPEWDGLRIAPCPPAWLGEVDVTRVWRGVKVRVRFDARDYRVGVNARVTLDGVVLPAASDGCGAIIATASVAVGGSNGVSGGRVLDVRVDWPEAPSRSGDRLVEAKRAAKAERVHP